MNNVFCNKTVAKLLTILRKSFFANLNLAYLG